MTLFKDMDEKKFIFIGGLHRSGTSLLHQILRSHPEISGFMNTGVSQDEGQLIQTVYPPAKFFGGPGVFAFDPGSYMNEKSSLSSTEKAEMLYRQWGVFWDLKKQYLIEKSPPNIIRTRYLQSLFPNTSFIIIFRHPIAVAFATMKWSNTNIGSLIEHTLRCYEIFWQDYLHIKRSFLLRYEDFVQEPSKNISRILDWLSLKSFEFVNEVRPNVNDKYFLMWENLKQKGNDFHLFNIEREMEQYEKRANAFGYSLLEPNNLRPVNWYCV